MRLLSLLNNISLRLVKSYISNFKVLLYGCRKKLVFVRGNNYKCSASPHFKTSCTNIETQPVYLVHTVSVWILIFFSFIQYTCTLLPSFAICIFFSNQINALLGNTCKSNCLLGLWNCVLVFKNNENLINKPDFEWFALLYTIIHV